MKNKLFGFRRINTSQEFAMNKELKRLWDAIESLKNEKVKEPEQEIVSEKKDVLEIENLETKSETDFETEQEIVSEKVTRKYKKSKDWV